MILELLDVLQQDPTVPDGPGDIPGYEVPKNAPTTALDWFARIGPGLGIFFAAGILIYAARRVFAAIPWKVVGPLLILVIIFVYVAK